MQLRLVFPKDVQDVTDVLNGVRAEIRALFLDLGSVRRGNNATPTIRPDCVLRRVDLVVQSTMCYVAEKPSEALSEVQAVMDQIEQARGCLRKIDHVIELMAHPTPDFVSGGFQEIIFGLEGQVMDLEHTFPQ